MMSISRMLSRFAPCLGRRLHAHGAILLILFTMALVAPASALEPLLINGDENGIRLGEHFELWHDPGGSKSLAEARQALTAGEFSVPASTRSTGLQPGAYWSHFSLRNESATDVPVHLEYVDHQLIHLNAYRRVSDGEGYTAIADFALDEPFSKREISHLRFVVPVMLAPGESAEFLLRFGSDGKGYVFPNLRIWSPKNLRNTQATENALMGILVGGLVLMALVALVTGVALSNTIFYAYFFYALAKIAVWTTVMGFTHQFVLRDNFHWSYMSMTGALSIFSGIWFVRLFLQTRRYIPKFDYLLKFMLFNAGVLVFAAVTRQTTLSVIVITIALLLYPALMVAGMLRWYQGAKEAAFYTVACTFLIGGLVAQAMRDLGLVEHNFINYYWPAVGSYTDMVVILGAMAMLIRKLRNQKTEAVLLHAQNLERSKIELEATVKERTKDLVAAKAIAELEARTDSLTGTNNRRSFMLQATVLFEQSKAQGDDFNILMFDIDYFKRINDAHGHSVGDLALIAFTKAMTTEIRDVDILGRLGGEEFALAFNGSREAAAQTAERLRAAVSDIRIDTDQGTLQFTTSVGVACYQGDSNIDQLIKRADTALYAGKELGRNRVEFSQPLRSDIDFTDRRNQPV